MKIYTSKYRDHWISPYTIIDYIFFWTDWSKCHRDKTFYKLDNEYIDRPEWVEKVTDKLTPISVFIQKVLDIVHPKINYIKIDRWDVWNMDSTLSPIIYPMLVKLKETKHGYGFIEDEDVPEELRSHNGTKENDYDWDSLAEARYEYVLNEMIFAFKHLMDDSWEEEYSSGNIDFKFVPCEDNPKLSKMVDGPNHTYTCDYEAIKKVYARIDNGTKLFGKYYRTLWD